MVDGVAYRVITRLGLKPFRTVRSAVPFWGQTTQIVSKLSPKRNCSP